MYKVLAIANQKGGVAKTTSAISLGVGLVNKGYLLWGNDVETTKQICSASELIGITMLDHIVIARAEEGRGEYAYLSMKNQGLMQE